MSKCELVRMQAALPVRPQIRLHNTGIDTDFLYAAIPSPHPTATPPGQEIPDAHDAVDHGHEVATLVHKYVDSTSKLMILTLAISTSSTAPPVVSVTDTKL